jgi:hypothetical protein
MPASSAERQRKNIIGAHVQEPRGYKTLLYGSVQPVVHDLDYAPVFAGAAMGALPVFALAGASGVARYDYGVGL